MSELEEHRSVQRLRECAPYCKSGWRGMSKWVLDAKARGDTWPEWCLLPQEGWRDLCLELRTDFDLNKPNSDILYEALGAWRLSKGIYRLAHDFSTELLRTSITGDVPVDVLKRLPEWCVYLDLEWFAKPDEIATAMGVWVWLSHSMFSKSDKLCIVVDLGTGLLPLGYDLKEGSVASMVEKCIGSQRQTTEAILDGLEAAGRVVDRDAELECYKTDLPKAHVWLLDTVLKMLLYLCSEEPEVDDREETEASPSRTGLQRVGPRNMFVAADRPRLWVVGEKIGKAIRQQREEPASGDRKRIRRHLRRAHWHGYWKGPRNSETRRFIYNWISPTVIGANSSAKSPAVPQD